MEEIKKKFIELYQKEKIFDPNYHDLSFDYEFIDQSILNLNHLCLIDRESLRYFLTKVGLNEYIDFDVKLTSSKTPTNSLLIDSKRESETSSTSLKSYSKLNRIIKSKIQEEVVYLTAKCFKLVKKVCPQFYEIKKVLYQADGMLDIELQNPIIQVLFLDDTKLAQRQARIFDIEEQKRQIVISRFMSIADINNILKDIYEAQFYKNEAISFS